MRLNVTPIALTLVLAAAGAGSAQTAPTAQVQTTQTASQAQTDWLESLRKSEARREERQRVGDIFAALEVKPGARVADIGAGWGFFTARLAKAVGPSGRVVAVEIDPKSLAKLRERIAKEGLTNVDVVEGTPRDTHLMAGSLDAVLIVNAYHEMPEHRIILQQIRQALRPNAPLVIVEPLDTLQREKTRAEQEKAHVIASRFVMDDLREAGFGIASLQDPFVRRGSVDEEWLVVARPLADLTRRPTTETADASLADRLSPKSRIYMDEFKALYEKSDVLVLDVRDASMYREGHIPGAFLVPPEKLAEYADALRDERRLIVAYCSCPAEETSLYAVKELAKLGITNTRALVGGYRLWAGQKNPVATGDSTCDGPLCPLKKSTSDSARNAPKP